MAMALVALAALLPWPGLAAQPVEQMVSRWRKAPQHVPSTHVPDGPLLGNGQMGITVGFSEWDVLDAKVAFHVGHNAFFAAPTGNWKISSCGYTDLTRAGRKALGGTAVGGLSVSFPASASTKPAGSAELFPANGSFVWSKGGAGIHAWVHAAEDVLILNLTSSVPGRAKLVLWTYNGCSGPPNPTAARNTTDALPTQAQQIGSTLHVARANGWEYQLQAYEVQWFHLLTAGEAGARLVNFSFTSQCGAVEGPCMTAEVEVSPHATMLTLELQKSSWKKPMPEPRALSDLSELERSHVQIWRHFWAKSFINLPDSQITTFYWHMSQYLLRISSTGYASPGLFGPFVNDDQVGWMGDLTLNYNAEASYYGAASSNHLELFEPYLQTILDYLPSARLMADSQYPGSACAGALYFAGHILPFGVTSSSNGDMGQKQMGLFASVPFILYWRYTRDPNFAQRAFPFFEGLARFWECVLVEEQDGLLHDAQDCAEELCSPDGVNQKDPTVVLSMLPAFFRTAGELAALLGHPESQRRWAAHARRIAAYPTARWRGKDVLRNSAGQGEESGPTGGQFASFPLGTVSLSSSATSLEVVRQSLEHFFDIWPGGKQGNSFCSIFAAANRVAWRPAHLFQLWESYLKNQSDPDCIMYPNGMVLGCGGTGLENVGATAYVNELLLQSHEGFLRIFPGWNSTGSFHLRAEGGFEVMAERDAAEVTSLSIHTLQRCSSSCRLRSPWKVSHVRVNGHMWPVTDGELEFPVAPRTSYELQPDRRFWV
ncbi:WW domain-containing oxidoreductase [Durusdinium trenchii]|uniref:WW domain-containing oxidoreductase n=1 Tax=Durusdinium trenchii TaxID=1381693 RepID=A0ABP0S8F3_9DINO